jgi:hypothetical protein
MNARTHKALATPRESYKVKNRPAGNWRTKSKMTKRQAKVRTYNVREELNLPATD